MVKRRCSRRRCGPRVMVLSARNGRRNSSYPTKFATTASDIAEAEQGDYFKVMIWSEAMRKEMVLPLDASFRFDLQFGRRVLGKLLGLQERTHWKDCGQSKAEEEKECDAFKELFAPYDFTAQ